MTQAIHNSMEPSSHIRVMDEWREDIPEDLMDAVKETAEGCPVEAIEL